MLNLSLNVPRSFKTSLIVFALGATVAVELRAMEPDKLFEKVSPSIVTVVAMRDREGKSFSFGSGVVIAPQTVITNCHVLQGGKVVVVKTSKQTYTATLEFPDVERDLCQLQVPDLHSPAAEMSSTSALRVGQRVYAIGNPRQLELTLSDGLISSLRDIKAGAPIIQTTAPISPGSSGGGLFNADGRLIGITSFQRKDSQNLNFANPVDWIRELPERGKEALAKYAANKNGGSSTPAPPVIATAPAQSSNSYPKAPIPPLGDSSHNPLPNSPYWAQRIAMLEQSRGQLTFSKAIALLFDINDPYALEQLRHFEKQIQEKPWQNAYAIGVNRKGNMIWGGGYRLSRMQFARDTAMEFCHRSEGDTCRVVMVNGEFSESEFVEFTKELRDRDISTLRSVFLKSLQQSPAESQTLGLSGQNSGVFQPPFGYTSIRE